MNWTDEQKEAIYNKGKNILVAAAAGSGKTAVLVERIINKIINEKINIDNLLVVTFTNAAASEMRERILNAIYKILDDEENPKDEETINHLLKQITLLNMAEICTIDSFCLDVIRNNFFEIEISPNFRIADTAEIELLKQEVLEKLFEEKYESEDEDFEKLIKTFTSYKDDTPLKDLILKIYTYIESNPFPLKWLEDKVENFNIKDINEDFSKNEFGKILLNEIKEELEDGIKKLQSEVKRLSLDSELVSCKQIILSDISQLQELLENIDNWDRAYNLAQNIDFIRWSVSKKITNPEVDKAKAIRDSVKKNYNDKKEKIFISNSEESNLDLQEMYQVLVKLKSLIIDFDKEFKKAKKEKNIVDFSDIEHLALEILLKEENGKFIPTEVAKKYQEKFVEIAIDEYQDSNLVQEYILTSVSKGNNIFMVGDVKQSIYKFRQAMPDLFLEKYEKYELNKINSELEMKKIDKEIKLEEHQEAIDSNSLQKESDFLKGQKIKLFKNFRSRENVLDFTNYIFQNIMSKNLGEIDYTKEEYLNPGANYKENDLIAEIDIIDCIENKNEQLLNNLDTSEVDFIENEKQEDSPEDEEKVEDIELEARFVAQKIKELIQNKFKVYDVKKEEFRDIKYKDIVILLRSTKNKANIFEKELIKQNINVYTDSSNQYLDSYEISIIMDLLKIIDNPYQDLPLVHVMLSCIGMFTDDDLLEIRLAEKNADFYTALLKSKLSVSKELKEKIETFLDKIDNWRKKNSYLELDELIWTIYEDTGFLNYVALMPNGEFRVQNLKSLFERAKKYQEASFNGLFNFINFMEKVKLGSGDLGAAKIISENEDVVRIMSIHKSKGLEFPVVFLSSSGSLFNMMDLNKDILLHQNLGIGVKYIDYDKQIKYDTLSKLALREKLLEENISEEMRILYVALTRAKEKIYITGIKKDYEKESQKMQELIDIYKKEDGKINPILIKKYKNYLDWIILCYKYNEEYAKTIMKIHVLKKQDISGNLKQETNENIDIIQFLEEGSKNISQEEIDVLKKKIEFEYKYKDLIDIPSKESVTNIVSKVKEHYAKENETSSQENLEEFPKPKFLAGTEEEIITAAKKGTLIHLCFKNLDFNKEYEMQDVKDLIEDLRVRGIITLKEAEAINPNIILKFTKSKIFEQLKTAKEYHKEEPFYINIPANEVVEIKSDENILVQGVIDLYYIDKDDNLILLDYKTDFIKEREEQVLINRHKAQLMLYKEALENGLNRKVNKIYIYSTGVGKEIEITNNTQ